MLLASNAPANVVTPVTPNVPPTVAFETTAKPVSVALLSVNVSAISAVLLASNAPVNVVTPVTPNVPPTVAFLVTAKPILSPEDLLNVNVSAILAVLPAVIVPDNVLVPVTANVPPTVAFWPILAFFSIPNPPAVLTEPEVLLVDCVVSVDTIVPVKLILSKPISPVTSNLPLIVALPVTSISPPILAFFPIPNPPAVFIAPEVVLLDSVKSVTLIVASLVIPLTDKLLATSNVPPIKADSFTPNPPVVLIEPVETLVESVVVVTLISPLAVIDDKAEAPVTANVPPTLTF